ncbi:MAG: TraX family protein [Spirochaetales bacterium]
MSKRNDILRLIAIITMAIDHIGLLFFPELLILRIIGRLAFPIFAYALATGFIKTSNRKRYFLTILIFAFIAQIPYMFLTENANFNPLQFNILFLFAYAIIVLYVIEEYKKQRAQNTIFKPLLLLILSIVMTLVPVILEHTLQIAFSYATYGVLMVIGFYLFNDFNKKNILLLSIWFVLINGFNIFYLIVGIGYQALSLVALPLIILLIKYTHPKFKLNKYVSYIFYPAHLAILVAIRLLIG